MPLIVLHLIIIMVFFCGAAEAQQLTLEVPRQGFIVIEDFRHWLGLKYEYTGVNNNSGSSSDTHRFQESYNMASNFSIMDRHLLNVQLDGQLSLNQVQSGNNVGDHGYGSGLNSQYRLLANAFDQSWYPVSVFSSREEYTSINPYSPSTVNTVNRNGVRGTLLGKNLTGTAQYEHLVQDSNGAYWNSSMASDTVSGTISHSVPNLTSTSLSGSWFSTSSDYNYGSQSGNGYTLSFNNALYTPRQNYRLSSSAMWQDSTISRIPLKSLSWTEVLTATLGRALTVDLSNAYTYSRTTGVLYTDQIYQMNQTKLDIRHRLFESLDTRLGGNYISRNYLGGSESDYGGDLSMTYTKNLPNASKLLVNINEMYQVVDRNLTYSTLVANDEKHTVTGEFVDLNLSGVITSISVTDLTHKPYIRDLDYQVDPNFARIRIMPPPGTITMGTVLLITYTVQVNPSISFGNNSFTVSTNLSLLNNRYNISGSVTLQDQSLLSGLATYYGLTNGHTGLIRAEANYLENRFSLEFYDYSYNSSGYRYFEGGWNFTRQYPLWSTTLRARDRYTLNNSSYYSRDSWTNTVDVGTSVNTVLGMYAQFQGAAWYVNTTGGDKPINDVYLRLSAQMQINQLYLSLIGQIRWRFFGSQQLSDYYARMELTRYF